MVLQFGRAAYENGLYGTILHNDTFASIAQIDDALRYFILGYNNCNENDAHHIRIAVGPTNNVNFPPSENASVTFAHGYAWATMVNDLMSMVQANGWAGRIVVDGAVDFESGLGWSDANAARLWVGGYDAVNTRFFYNFGHAACSIPDGYDGAHDVDACNPGWTLDDFRFVSFGHAAALALPEIYATNGYHAIQWHAVKLRSVTLGNVKHIPGVLTQYAACEYTDSLPTTDPEETCVALGTNNTPDEGWLDLWNALYNDPATRQSSLQFLSDISWLDP
jgi:hypothetical protein